MLRKMLEERGIMQVWDQEKEDWPTCRQRLIDLLCREEYGYVLRLHDKITWEVVSTSPDNYYAGRITCQKVLLTVHFGEDSVTFPVHTAIPKREGKHPFFVFLNFSDNVPDKYLPLEEICDKGYGVISFYYQDVSKDNEPFEGYHNDRLEDAAPVITGAGERTPETCGSIAIWAWAASRVMDYACMLEKLDPSRATVIGHSRLGKTALLAGALDERFSCVVSNDSGCCGAAVTRGKDGEQIDILIEVRSHWFCDNFKKYYGKPESMPFDQHFLLAAIAPRKVYVASAEKDDWADPVSEYLSCFAASEVYEKMGLKGFVCPDRLPRVGEQFHQGNIGYHLRSGCHSLSREDWNKIMDYLEGAEEKCGSTMQ